MSHWLETEVTEIAIRLDSIERKIKTRQLTDSNERLDRLESITHELVKITRRQQAALEELSEDYAERNAEREH